MSPPVEFQLDTDVNALYIKLESGAVARTVMLTDSIYADVDAEGTPIGFEFVNADAFVPFQRHHAGDVNLPPRVRELFRVLGG